MTDNSSTKAPTIDPKAWQRNKTTACLEFVDRLSSWLWQDNEGAARCSTTPNDTGPRPIRQGTRPVSNRRYSISPASNMPS